MSISPVSSQSSVSSVSSVGPVGPQKSEKYGLQNPNTMVGKIEAISDIFLKVVAFFFYAVFNVVFVLLPLLFDHIINGTKPTPPLALDGGSPQTAPSGTDGTDGTDGADGAGEKSGDAGTPALGTGTIPPVPAHVADGSIPPPPGPAPAASAASAVVVLDASGGAASADLLGKIRGTSFNDADRTSARARAARANARADAAKAAEAGRGRGRGRGGNHTSSITLNKSMDPTVLAARAAAAQGARRGAN